MRGVGEQHLRFRTYAAGHRRKSTTNGVCRLPLMNYMHRHVVMELYISMTLWTAKLLVEQNSLKSVLSLMCIPRAVRCVATVHIIVDKCGKERLYSRYRIRNKKLTSCNHLIRHQSRKLDMFCIPGMFLLFIPMVY